MVRSGRALIIILVCIMPVVSSCDIFWNMPWGKNPHDPTSQIGVVRAVRAGDGAIAVAWDWRPFLDNDPVFNLDIDPKREIVELRLLHGTGSAPAFVPPIPFGEELSDRLDPEGWYKIFDDLNEDREHYFSIYGKEQSGQWVGPWTVRGHVDWGSGTNTGTLTVSTETWMINIGDPGSVNLGAGTDIIDGSTAAVYSYDPAGLEDMGFIESASGVSIPVTAPVTGTISFYPLRYAWDGAAPGAYEILMNSRFTKDETGAVHKPITNLTTSITLSPDEVKRLVSRMALLGSWRILVEASNMGKVSTFNPPAFSFNYWWN